MRPIGAVLVALMLTPGLAACGKSAEPDSDKAAAQPPKAKTRWGRDQARPEETDGSTRIGTIAIRGKGSIEERCHAAVADESGDDVTGTDRIAETDDAVLVFVKVDGGDGPWQCRATRDGEIESVSGPDTA